MHHLLTNDAPGLNGLTAAAFVLSVPSVLLDG